MKDVVVVNQPIFLGKTLASSCRQWALVRTLRIKEQLKFFVTCIRHYDDYCKFILLITQYCTVMPKTYLVVIAVGVIVDLILDARLVEVECSVKEHVRIARHCPAWKKLNKVTGFTCCTDLRQEGISRCPSVRSFRR